MIKKSSRSRRADGGSTPAIEVAKGRPQGAMRGGFDHSPSEEIARGKPDATYSGNKRAMPSQALSLGRAEARTTGPNSKSMALGRTMGRIRGKPLARELAVGQTLGKREGTNAKDMLTRGRAIGRRGKFAEGGNPSDMGFEKKGERLRLSRKRNEILGQPPYKTGGLVHRGMKALYEALHGHFENEPYMKKLGANKADVSEGAPRRASRGGRMWIAEATKNKGALHRSLRVPEGQKIPEKKLEKAEHSRNPLTRKRARLAETLKGFHH